MKVLKIVWLVIFIGLGCLLSGCGDTEPNTVSDYFEEGYGYYYNGKYKQAITAFQKVVEIDPSYVRAHFFMGVVYREQGRLEDAITKLKQTIEIDPKDLTREEAYTVEEAYIALGQIYRQQGKLEDVIASYQKVVEIDLNVTT